MKIEIVEYSPEWVKVFEDESQELLSILGSNVMAIEHVGSTSIPNQKAKPIIDIFIGVSPLEDIAFYESLFSFENYCYTDTGMKNRYLFTRYTEGIWTHNIHILPYEGFYLRNEILFRDYLRKHPELVIKYGELKEKVAIDFGETMADYTRAKTEFIQSVVDNARREKGLPLENVWGE